MIEPLASILPAQAAVIDRRLACQCAERQIESKLQRDTLLFAQLATDPMQTEVSLMPRRIARNEAQSAAGSMRSSGSVGGE
jgi:hypothetical protein